MQDQRKLVKALREGKIIIYPTDTIYGIGCDASNFEAVEKIRRIKHRENKPFSVIAPSKAWIQENFEISGREKYIEMLPGKITLILKLKSGRKIVAGNVNLSLRSLGVRIPNNWFSEIVKKFGKPVVTTSVNIAGEKAISEIKEIPKEILDNVDIVVDEGRLEGRASRVIELTSKEEKIIRE